MHPSTGTRLCDQLIDKRMLSRRADPMDRRYVVLKLTVSGRQLVEQVDEERQRDIETILQRLPDEEARRRLVTALTEFAEAAGEMATDPLWALTKGSRSRS